MVAHVHDDVTREQEGKRARLTLDIEPELHLRIKLAAAQQYLSMRDYVERILLAAVPPLPANERLQQRRPMSPDVIALLRETRHAVSEGRTLPDSTDLIHRMREERSEHVAKL